MAGWNLTSAGSRVPRDRQRRPDRRGRPDRRPGGRDSMSTRTEAVLGVDVGTSSTKGVLVALDGTVLDVAVREHSVQRPAPGHVEMDARIWWTEFISIARELTTGVDAEVTAIGVSGMGPCAVLTDEHGDPVRPAILYGVDTRAEDQIERLTAQLGAEEILARGSCALSSQAAGPKVAWVAQQDRKSTRLNSSHVATSDAVFCLKKKNGDD